MSNINLNTLPPAMLPLAIEARRHSEALAHNRAEGGSDSDYVRRVFAAVDVVHVIYPCGKTAGLCLAKGRALVQRTVDGQLPLICRMTAFQASCAEEAWAMGEVFGDLKREDLAHG